MSKKQKERAEKHHRAVYGLLVREFPDCKVTYDGREGLDNVIECKGHATWVETKTCESIIGSGIDRTRMRKDDKPVIFEKKRLGRFKFDRRPVFPYKLSQHDDLVMLKGWYVFLVGARGGPRSVFGISARNLKLSEKPTMKRIAWSSVVRQCEPDWLDMLKAQVYGTDIPRQTRIGLRGPVKELHDVWFKECDQQGCPIIEHLIRRKR